MAKGNEILLELKAENKRLKAKLKESESKIEKLEKKIKSAGSSIGNFFKGIGRLITTYFGYQAIKYITDLAGEIDSVGKSFRNLASVAQGGSKGLLDAMKKASKGTVAEIDMMRTANQALLLMGDDVAKYIPKMMKIATAAARNQGVKVANMFRDIVVASGRQSVMILDNLNISSKAAARYQEEYARKLGKTRDKLNQTQKSAAFFYAVMKAGGEVIDNVGNESLTLGERQQILDAQFKNASSTLSKRLVPALNRLFDTLNEESSTGDSAIKSIGDFLAFLIGSFALAIDTIKYLPDVIDHNWKMIVFDTKKALLEMEIAVKEFFGQDVSKLKDELLFDFTLLPDMSEGYKEYQRKIEEFVKFRESIGKKLEENEKRRQKRISQNLSNELDGRNANRYLKESEYYAYIGELELAALERERVKYNEMLNMKAKFQRNVYAIDEAYQKKRYLSEIKASKERRKQDAEYLKAKVGLYSKDFEAMQASANAGTRLMRSKNKWLFRMGKALAYAQAVMNAAQAITKAWAQWGWPLGAVFSAITAAATGVAIAEIKSTKMPSYQKGRVPVLADGYVPKDHFPALIGAKEAVITERATIANADILKYMNDTGKRYEPGSPIIVNQNNNFTGNILSKDFITDQVMPELETQARYMGRELFSEK